MARQGREFEIEYQKYYTMLDPSKYTIESPCLLTDKITGIKREVDILITFKDRDDIERKISIECRDRPNTVQDVTWIEQLITKKIDLGIDITIATCTKSFSSPAIQKAEYYGILVEESIKIDENYIKKLSEEEYFTVSFLSVKAIDLSFLDEQGILIKKNEIKKITTSIEKKKIELLINEKFMWSEYINHNYSKIFNNDRYGITCINPKINLNIDLEENNQKTVFRRKLSKIIFVLEISTFNLNIPLIEGLIINDANSKNLSGYRKGFESSDIGIQEAMFSNPNSLLMEFNLKKIISEDFKFISLITPPNKQSISLNSGSQISILIRDFSPNKFLGKVNFNKIW